MANFAKKLVSKKKRRFQEDGFDLDLTFITKNVVAMGFPSEGLEGMYRNGLSDVKKFFDSRHKDHYKIYNLCSERDYDPAKFYGRVAKYPFDDHNAPPFVLIQPFCEDVHEYLSADERNVAVIHCKAGKGRTGVMICAYLLHCKMWEDTQDALEFYGHARTKNGKGVTIPSQNRYVHYYGRFVTERLTYRPTTMIFTHVKLVGIPDISKGTCVPFFTIRQGPEQVQIHKSEPAEGIDKKQGEVVIRLSPPVPVCGDIKMEFFHKTGRGKEKMFNIWFNTFFVQEDKMVAPKMTIDKANKDKKHKIYPADFAVEFQFETPAELKRETQEAEKAVAAKEAEARSNAGRASQGTGSFRRDSAAQPADDADLTDDSGDDDEDEWEGLPITDV